MHSPSCQVFQWRFPTSSLKRNAKMTPSYIPQRVKRAKQQITVKLYQDQLDMLNSYGRFIDDGREYIISQALELVFTKGKEFARLLEQQAGSEKHLERMGSRNGSATAIVVGLSNPKCPVCGLSVRWHGVGS
jgi:hypothetical protein